MPRLIEEVPVAGLADVGVGKRLSVIVVSGVVVAACVTGIGMWSQGRLAGQGGTVHAFAMTKAALNHLDTRESD